MWTAALAGSNIGSQAIRKRVLADAFYLSDKFFDERPCTDRIVQGDIFADISQIIFNARSEFQSQLEPAVLGYRELLAQPAKYGFRCDTWPLVPDSFTPDALQVCDIILDGPVVHDFRGS